MGQHPSHLARPTIPVAYLELLVEILAEKGVPRAALLDGLGLEPSALERADARMSGLVWTRAVLRALELTRDPGLGYEYGLRTRPTAHGLLGYAAMTSPTMREAIEVTVRYVGVRQAHFTMEPELDAMPPRVILRERYPITVLRAFFHENILLGLARGSAVLLGRPLSDFPDLTITFDTPEPPYFRAWRDRLPRVAFDAAENAVVFPRGYLDLRPALADPQASKQATALCERELALASAAEDDVARRVRLELERGFDGAVPQLDQVAAALGMSGRTLKRRLMDAGTTFSRTLREARERRATEWLTGSDLPVQAIASRLGYENPANFSRAFVEWTGESPTARRARGARG